MSLSVNTYYGFDLGCCEDLDIEDLISKQPEDEQDYFCSYNYNEKLKHLELKTSHCYDFSNYFICPKENSEKTGYYMSPVYHNQLITPTVTDEMWAEFKMVFNDFGKDWDSQPLIGWMSTATYY